MSENTMNKPNTDTKNVPISTGVKGGDDKWGGKTKGPDRRRNRNRDRDDD